ncbi:Octopamine receptor [Holothuria leucospilota]|uniref:Octopamine receptor n=1 Tax=Holothuria leucospilota TaxID=206669 RepID=A0A9Q0YS57_HOLLE|nr:Octopamine receptor [Holothuria leucospilota]
MDPHPVYPESNFHDQTGSNEDDTYRLQQTNLTAFQTVIIALTFSIVLLTSIFGNILVCVAVATEDRLRKVGNYFLVSLAMADLLVSILVMSFAAVNDLLGHWVFNRNFCTIWISFDIMFSTASILNICAISVDRYMHIKLPFKYYTWMNTKTVVAMITLVWLLSALISFIPINLGWHEIQEPDVTEIPTYVVPLATVSPLRSSDYSNALHNISPFPSSRFGSHLLLTSDSNVIQDSISYLKQSGNTYPSSIYLSTISPLEQTSPVPDSASRKAFNCAMKLNATYAVVSSLVSFVIPCVIMLTIYALIYSAVRTRTKNARRGRLTIKTASGGKKTAPVSESAYHIANQQALSDRKAAITLGIIMGVFLACWLPFFIYNIILPIFPSCPFIPALYLTLVWLGYLNSCLNPVIYSIFNRDFREAFKRILFRRMLCRNSRSRPIYKHSRSLQSLNGRSSRYNTLNGKKHFSGTNLVEFYSNSSTDTLKEKVTPT